MTIAVLALAPIYGGSQDALVSGRFRGAHVHAHFDRNGGCEIARGNRVGFLFPTSLSS
jgi:hypothetical protein